MRLTPGFTGVTQKCADIVRIAPAIPFTETELQMAVEACKTRLRKGSDLALGNPRHGSELSYYLSRAEQDALFFQSQHQLDCGFLFVKLAAGTSLFGKQKAVYASYLEEPLGADAWLSGPVFKSWSIASTSMGNVYRGNGFP